MKNTLLFIFLSLISSVCFSQSIYKCTNQDGDIAYTDQPCSEKEKSSTVKLKKPSYHELGWLEEYKRKEKIEKAELLKTIKDELLLCGNFSVEYLTTYQRTNGEYSIKPQVGMTKNEVVYISGKPDRVNTSSYGADQWVYRSGYVSTFVYFQGGCVVSWQR